MIHVSATGQSPSALDAYSDTESTEAVWSEVDDSLFMAKASGVVKSVIVS